jgi:hypothetical protein
MPVYGKVLSITPVRVLLAFKVVKEILIGVGGGADRVICKIAFCVMVEKNPVMILSLATLSLFDPRKSGKTFSLPRQQSNCNCTMREAR